MCGQVDQPLLIQRTMILVNLRESFTFRDFDLFLHVFMCFVNVPVLSLLQFNFGGFEGRNPAPVDVQ